MQYHVASSGLVNLFQSIDLPSSLILSAQDETLDRRDVHSAPFMLVLAIGAQTLNDKRADAWHNRAKSILLDNFCTDMTISTVQGFILLALHMLRAFQPNAAYLYFCEHMAA